MMSASHTPEETKAALHEVVTEMYDKIVKGEPPTMTLPVRTKNNIGFDKNLGVYKYGKKRYDYKRDLAIKTLGYSSTGFPSGGESKRAALRAA